MRALVDGRWADALLDEDPSGRVLIRVRRFANVERLRGLYFERPRNWRMVLNYLRHIGLRDVLRKIRSRESERTRNEKYLSIGAGNVLEAPDDTPFGVGDAVVFIATAQPACVERVAVPPDLVMFVDAEQDNGIGLLYYDHVPDDVRARLHPLAGYSAYSGVAPEDPDRALDMAAAALANLSAEDAWMLPSPTATGHTTWRAGSPRRVPERMTGTLFGYGNYAKTVIIPGVDPFVDIVRVHDIDPTQIPREPGRFDWSTSARLDPDDDSDAVFIAGYHHTHAPLAIEALRRGKYAVIEKPAATTHAQLRDLADAAAACRAFVCFQRRYMEFNDWLREDLGADNGHPVSYHCIVYEVPLPERHWYRWPNSRTRLVSNGCHWIDHFLFLNDFAAPTRRAVTEASDGTVQSILELANGAVFTMVLTDRGSDRLGIRDYIEIRTEGGTCTIIDSTDYAAENRSRVVRRARRNRLDHFRAMYCEIGRRIAAGEPGDSARSIEVSASTVLLLEDMLESRSAKFGLADPVGVDD